MLQYCAEVTYQGPRVSGWQVLANPMVDILLFVNFEFLKIINIIYYLS